VNDSLKIKYLSEFSVKLFTENRISYPTFQWTTHWK